MGAIKRYQREIAPGGFVDLPPGYPSTNLRQLVLRTAYAQFNFATDGGLISTITPKLTWLLPATALIFSGVINVPTACTGAAGTLAIGTSAGSAANSILAATAVASLGTNVVLLTTCATTPFKMSAAGNITFTIATTPFSAGLVEVFLKYWIPVNA
jgi:hypothetical protein